MRAALLRYGEGGLGGEIAAQTRSGNELGGISHVGRYGLEPVSLPIGASTLAVEPGCICVATARPGAGGGAVGQGRRTWGLSVRQLFGHGLVAIFNLRRWAHVCQRLALVARLPSAHGWWGGEMRGPDNCRVMLYLVDSMGAPAFQSVPVDVARSASGS